MAMDHYLGEMKMAKSKRGYYPCRKHRLWFSSSVCPECYKELRRKDSK
jgi:hypothetical protein